MRKFCTAAGIIALLLLAAWAAPEGTKQQQLPANPQVKEFIQEEIQKMSKTWDLFKLELSYEDTPYEAFNDFRLRYKTLEFLAPTFMEPKVLSQINGSKFWVWRDNNAKRRYDEAGNMQRLEYLLLNDYVPGEKAYFRSTSEIDDLIDNFSEAAAQMEMNLVDYLYAIQMAQYRSYFRSVAGRERIDTNQILAEYQANLEGQVEVTKRLAETNGEYKRELSSISNRLKKAQRFLKSTDFSELDRMQFMDEHLRELWGEISDLLRNVREGDYIPEWAELYQWKGDDPFSDNWLNPGAFQAIDPTTERAALVELGKLLFFDPLLSKNSRRTCASCHKPQKAFSDGRQTSQGFDLAEKLERNAPSLINTVFNRQFGHDNFHPSMAGQILSVIDHPQEFRAEMDTILARLNTSQEYRNLFREAFPTRPLIDSTRVLQAITAYTYSLISFNSPFDRYMRGEKQSLEPAAAKGYNLFMGKAQCGGCHFPPLFSGIVPPGYQTQEYHSHGVHRGLIWEDESMDRDYGVGKQKGEDYYYFFKTPSLRNLGFTAPYMHNGIFNDLDGTLEYLSNTQENADRRANFPPGAIRLNKTEQGNIKAFLMSLNDSTVVEKYNEDIALPRTDGSRVPADRKAGGIY